MASGTGTRPTGITILAVLAGITGVFALFGGFLIVFAGGALGAASGSASIGALGALVGLLTLALGAVELALAYGFWTLKPWAYQAGILIEAAAIVIAILQGLFGGAELISLSTIIGVAIPAVIIYYLTTPPVKAAFGQK